MLLILLLQVLHMMRPRFKCCCIHAARGLAGHNDMAIAP